MAEIQAIQDVEAAKAGFYKTKMAWQVLMQNMVKALPSKF